MNNLVFTLPFIAFPLFWIFTVWLISIISGWPTLARHYAYINHAAKPNVLFRWQSLSMGYARFFPANYQNVINVGCDETYLYLSVMFPFRVGHTPLKIPFSEINITDPKFRLSKAKCVIAKEAPNVKIHLNGRLVKKIEQGFLVAAPTSLPKN